MRFLFWLLLSTLTFGSVFAQDFTLYENNFQLTFFKGERSQRIRLTGNFMVPSDYTKARQVFRHLDPRVPILVVELGFGGGLDNPIENFARHIKRYCRENDCQVVTVLPARYQCASYCVPIYMSGEIRAAVDGSYFGFHVSTFHTLIGRFNSVSAMLGNYAQYGVDRDWLEANRRYFVRPEVTYVSPGNLEGSNIVTHLFESNAEFENFVTRL